VLPIQPVVTLDRSKPPEQLGSVPTKAPHTKPSKNAFALPEPSKPSRSAETVAVASAKLPKS